MSRPRTSAEARARARRNADPGRAFALDVGAVLAAWAVLLALENLVVGIAFRDELAGSWEMAHARLYLSPLALGAAFPLAMLAVIVGRLAAARRARELAALAVLAACAGAAVGLGVSTGRHMESLAIRAPFVVVVALACAAGAAILARRAPIERPRLVAAIGAGVAATAWLADARVLPRLYPTFHTALFVVTLGAWAATPLVLWGTRARAVTSALGLALVTASLAWTSHAAAAIRNDDNLRRVLLERAPLLGRAVVVATRIAPPPPILEDEAAIALVERRGGDDASRSRALDWRGHDLVLVTVDALRADHVSSYGYARRTTPNIDRLAARGARFVHAYCPTPHTSYSVTSMMVGSYMRPLLAMGAAEDAETWPSYLRRYGWRTAAFYPPAVFFIDEHRFRRMRDEGLGFEYRKVEFAKPELRRAQIDRYLAQATLDKPLFLWVHLFEPHEPYEMNAAHPFEGDPRVDAYDSEVATADSAVGDIVAAVERRRGTTRAIFVVSADHGEEFGDHGGRYHGTTVYEEQVRVPLVVVAPGVAPRAIEEPVQTIDLLPTTLAALDIPMPARVRGRDLGGVLAGRPGADEGLAFAETDDFTLLARGPDRLVCARRVGACTLYDVTKDPEERRPVTSRPERVAELRRITAAVERENGRIERAAMPEALRRCAQGDRDAAEDVAPLLDDARVDIRRSAARCAFGLRASEMAPQLRRAFETDEDADVRTWAALALLRLRDDPRTGLAGPAGPAGADITAQADGALRHGEPAQRVAAALAFAARGDARGEGELTARFEAGFASREGAAGEAGAAGELDEARELVAALATIRARSATPALARSLADVRLRPYVVEALAEIGDARARAPLLETFAGERYVNVRGAEARALIRLGAQDELAAPLARFAGVPDPMPDAIAIARDASLLRAERGGIAWDARPTATQASVRAPGAQGRARLLVLVAPGAGELTARVDGVEVAARAVPPAMPATPATPAPTAATGTTWVAELDARPASPAPSPKVALDLAHPAGLLAAWIVPLAAEIPPPPPRAWKDAGPDEPFLLESAP